MGNFEDKEKLEKFVFPNEDLENLESLLSSFNLFEAIGMSTQEIRHSTTLAFLLAPQNNHGLDQYFLKRLLKKVAQKHSDKLSPIDIDCANFADAEVRREWKHIDILIISNSANLVIAIENKIFASESDGQLSKYNEIVTKEFPNHKLIQIYLTVGGFAPRKIQDEKKWVTLSHAEVVEEMEISLRLKENNIGRDQEILIRHYIDLMRRRVLSNSEIAMLARKIYNTHKQAIDIIIDHKIDLRSEVKDYLVTKVLESGFELDRCTKSLVRFFHKDWKFGRTWRADNWGDENRGVLFEITTNPDDLQLDLVIGNMASDKKKMLLQEICSELREAPPALTAWPRAWRFGNSPNLEPSSEDGNYWEKQIDSWWNCFLRNDKEHVCRSVGEALTALGDQVETYKDHEDCTTVC